MGKNERTLKNRSKFKGENPTPKPLPAIEDEPLSFEAKESEVMESGDDGSEVKNSYLEEVAGSAQGNSVEVTADGEESEVKTEPEFSDEDEESDARPPVQEKVVKKQPVCKKCERAKSHAAKVRKYASQRGGVRVKDEADKIIDSVRRMKAKDTL